MQLAEKKKWWGKLPLRLPHHSLLLTLPCSNDLLRQLLELCSLTCRKVRLRDDQTTALRQFDWNQELLLYPT